MTEADIVYAMMAAYGNALLADDATYQSAMRAALRIAIPWAREQALREAASVAKQFEDGGYHECRVAAEIEALIPARPETTDE